ncbi:MAG: hypothetical protein QF579_00665 [Dehalococcoidia bacterium]|nr:hypothetical protein [Dehalococcoidia bacterium]
MAVLAVDKLAPSLNSWVESDILTVIGIVMLGYTAVLGSLGALVGGYVIGRSLRLEKASTNVPLSD